MNALSRRFHFDLVDVLLVGAIASLVALLFLRHPNPTPSVAAEPAGAVEQAQDVAKAAGAEAPAISKPPVEWGIEVIGLYPAVGGRVLDLRYKILDKAKAAQLPNELGGIYIIDEATGMRTQLPNSAKTGSIPQNPQKLEVGRTYSFSFPNQFTSFKSGSKVTLVIGTFRAEHLVVQ